MAHTTVAPGPAPAPTNVFSRFIGILTAPKATFETVAAHPKWLGMFLLTTALVVFGTVLPMTTEAGQQATLDMQVKQMESFGVQVNDQAYERMRQRMSIAPYTTAAGVLIVSPIILTIYAGILFAIFNAALGGSATFKQVYSVVVHAGAVQAAGALFTGPLNYFRGAMSSATNLSVLLPMLDETSFVGRLAGTVDLFLIWWLVVMAMGLAVLYRRRTQPIAISLFAVYAVIAVTIAIIRTSLGGSPQ